MKPKESPTLVGRWGQVQSSESGGDSLARLTMQAMMMTVPPTNDTTDSILATRPSRTAPSRFPCSKLFLD